jgi:hyperosmotically inducible periplasmic protein
MSSFRSLMSALALGALVAGSACSQNAADEAKREGDATLNAAQQHVDTAVDKAQEHVDTAVDKTQEHVDTTVDKAQEAGESTADAGKNIAQKTADKTKAIVATVGSKTSEIVSTTGGAITDGSITTAVSSGFVGEALLKGSDINVDTKDHVVTLKGVVGSGAAKTQAAEIARGTKGVTRVVNQLVVK